MASPNLATFSWSCKKIESRFNALHFVSSTTIGFNSMDSSILQLVLLASQPQKNSLQAWVSSMAWSRPPPLSLSLSIGFYPDQWSPSFHPVAPSRSLYLQLGFKAKIISNITLVCPNFLHPNLNFSQRLNFVSNWFLQILNRQYDAHTKHTMLVGNQLTNNTQICIASNP